MRPKIAIGVPYYGQQSANWWAPLAHFVGSLHKIGVEYCGVLTAGSSETGNNRNQIVKSLFVETTADWLFWVDTDNPPKASGLRSLLDINKTLVTGVYFKKGDPYEPVIYYRLPTGWYRPIADYERGEIIPISGGGLGALLTHRSVYEDIQKEHVALSRLSGGYIVLPKKSIRGKVPTFDEIKPHPYAGQVKKGILYDPVYQPDKPVDPFPFFMSQYTRTEDFAFYELAAAVGHLVWADTRVEIGHLAEKEITGSDHREARYKIAEVVVGEEVALS